MKTRKFALLLNLITIVVLSILLGLGIFAWYTDTTQEEPVEIVTTGLVLSYKIDDESETNPQTFSVSDISFFDFDNEKEGKYLTDMAIRVTVVVENKSKRDASVTLSQTGLVNTSPYIYCAIANEKIDSTNTSKSPKDFLDDINVSYTCNSNASYKLTSDETFQKEGYVVASIKETDTITEDNKYYKKNDDGTYTALKTTDSFEYEYVEDNTIDSEKEFKANTYYTKTEGKEGYVVATEFKTDTTYYSKRLKTYYTKVSNKEYFVKGDYEEVSVTAGKKREGTYYEDSTGNFIETSDETFSDKKTYYKKVSDNGFTKTNTITEGTKVTENTYYEKTSGTLTSKYDETSKEGGFSVFYLYIFGVQPNDSAKNSEFLGDDHKYSFSIVISATA